MDVLHHPGVVAELARLSAPERAALQTAFEKLEALGAQLPFPHQSAVRGAPGFRELRPRAGRSRWRALYRQIGKAMVVLAIGPEAQVDRRGFDRAVSQARERFAEIEPPPKRKGKKK